MTAEYSVFFRGTSSITSSHKASASDSSMAGFRFRFRGVFRDNWDRGSGSEYEAMADSVLSD